MKGQRFIGLLALAVVLLTGADGGEERETPLPRLGPAGWARVDGQDHDLDEMLSLLRPSGAEPLAIFAPAQSWKPFYDKIFGQDPIDLAFYAVIYSLALDDPDPPNLNDWPSFYLEPPATPELLDSPSSEAVTFRTTFVPAGEDDRQEATVYTVFVSLILEGRRMFFLNLFQIDPDDPSEMERLALAWRTEFLETLTEESAQ